MLLPHSAGDVSITRAYREVILPALARFTPDIMLVSSGCDAHRRDPLAGLEVSTAGYTQVAREVSEAAERLSGGRVVVCLEGGDEHALAWCAGSLVSLLLGEEPVPEPDVTSLLEAVKQAIKVP